MNKQIEDLLDGYAAFLLAPLGEYPKHALSTTETVIAIKKLMREFAEEVVGKNLPPNEITESGPTYSKAQRAINMGKAGQRTRMVELLEEGMFNSEPTISDSIPPITSNDLINDMEADSHPTTNH